MKIKKLDSLSLKELFALGIIFILLGFTLGVFLKDKGVVAELLFILIIFTGFIFLIVCSSKFLIKLEQQGKIKILREEPPANLKEFILLIIIPLIFLTFFSYWFEIRPKQIELKCFKEAITTETDFDFVSESSEKNIMKEKYEECLKRHKFKEINFLDILFRIFSR